jgi:prepilin-type processing-associated H-X9-DG protein
LAAIEEEMQRLLNTPVDVFNCPSRRTGGPYACQAQYQQYLSGVSSTGETVTLHCELACRADYAACAGSQGFNEISAGPPSLAVGDDMTYSWPSTARCSGVIFQRSAVPISAISRGTSNTFLAGERYIDTNHYFDGFDIGDNEAMYAGFDNDVARVTLYPPLRDRANSSNPKLFGSAHAAGANMLYCDGAIRMIAYDVDADLFLLQGKRHE